MAAPSRYGDHMIAPVPQPPAIAASMSNAEADRLLASVRGTENRALLFGIDYRSARSTHLRVMVFSLLASVALVGVAAALLVPLYIASGGGWIIDVAPLVMGFASIIVALPVAYLVVGVALNATLRMSLLLQQVIGVVALVLAETGALVLVAAAGEGVWWAVGMIIGAFIAPLANLTGVLSLLFALWLPLPGHAAIVRQHLAIPAWQTVLGGQSRWIVSSHIAITVGTIAAAIAIVATPLAAIAVVLVRITGGLAAAMLGLRGRRRASIAALFATSVAIIAIAFVVA